MEADVNPPFIRESLEVHLLSLASQPKAAAAGAVPALEGQ
jgi:hypothetical protein